MQRNEHHVSTRCTHRVHRSTHGRNDVPKLEHALQLVPVPHRGPWSGRADDTDAQRTPRHDRRRRKRTRSVGAKHICRQKRKACMRGRALERFQAVVEFVVTDRGGIVSHHGHCRHHRMRCTCRRTSCQVRQRSPLKQVTRIQQYRHAGLLGTDRLGQGRGTGKRAGRIRCGAEIVPAAQMSVDVGGRHDDQLDSVRMRRENHRWGRRLGAPREQRSYGEREH